MNQNHKDYLDEMGYDNDQYVVINPKIYAAAKQKKGFDMFTVPIINPEEIAKVGMGHAVASIEWLQSRDVMLWEDFWAWANKGQAEPSKEANTMAQNMEQIPTNTAEQAFGKPDLPAGPPPPPAEPEAPQSEEEVWDFSKYVQRIEYVKSKGLELDTSAKGYVNKAGDRFIDLNVVKVFDNPYQFEAFVEEELSKPWVHPNKEIQEEAVPDIADGIEDAVVEETVEEKPVEKPKEETTKLSNDQIAENRHAITDWLSKNGFEMDKNTYSWSRKTEDPTIVTKFRHSDINDFAMDMKKWEEAKNNLRPEKSKEVVDSDKESDLDKIKEIAKASDNVVVGSVPKHESSLEEQEIGKDVDEGEEVVVSDADDFLAKLASFSFSQLKLSITRKNADNVGNPEEKISVTIEPLSFEDEPEFLKLKPLVLSGTVKELSENFWKVVEKPLKVTETLFTNSDTYLKELKAAEKKSKMEKAKGDKLKKAKEALKKYSEGEKKTETTFKKKIDAVLELDPKDKEALEFQDKLNQKTLL